MWVAELGEGLRGAECKLVVKHRDGRITWEQGVNRVVSAECGQVFLAFGDPGNTMVVGDVRGGEDREVWEREGEEGEAEAVSEDRKWGEEGGEVGVVTSQAGEGGEDREQARKEEMALTKDDGGGDGPGAAGEMEVYLNGEEVDQTDDVVIAAAFALGGGAEVGEGEENGEEVAEGEGDDERAVAQAEVEKEEEERAVAHAEVETEGEERAVANAEVEKEEEERGGTEESAVEVVLECQHDVGFGNHLRVVGSLEQLGEAMSDLHASTRPVGLSVRCRNACPAFTRPPLAGGCSAGRAACFTPEKGQRPRCDQRAGRRSVAARLM